MVAGRNVEGDTFEGFLLLMAFPFAVAAGWNLGTEDGAINLGDDAFAALAADASIVVLVVSGGRR